MWRLAKRERSHRESEAGLCPSMLSWREESIYLWLVLPDTVLQKKERTTRYRSLMFSHFKSQWVESTNQWCSRSTKQSYSIPCALSVTKINHLMLTLKHGLRLLLNILILSCFLFLKNKNKYTVVTCNCILCMFCTLFSPMSPDSSGTFFYWNSAYNNE